jgi:hypothetical protein
MTIDWYVTINEDAPDSLKSDRALQNVINTTTPVMKYFCEKLTSIKEWSVKDAERIFIEIVDEMPVMNARIINNEFVISYSRYISIRLIDNTTQIYRDVKLESIIKNKLKNE